MRTTLLICLLVTISLPTISGCESSTEPETPEFKNGSSAKLAIEMPPFFPPEPRKASVTTEWWVLQTGKLWFANVEKDPVDLTLWVTEVRTGVRERVGVYALNGYETKPMTLDVQFTTNDYRGTDWYWHLSFQQRSLNKSIIVGVAD